MRLFTKKRAVILGVVAAMAISAVAFAYFTNSGSGTGSAAVGTSSAATITQTNTLGALYPTTSQPVNLDIKNTGSGAQYVDKVHLDSITADTSHASCDVSSSGANAAFTMADVTVGETLAAGATTSKSGTLAMNDTGVSQDSCQGATLTLHFSSN
ncbi:MAG TPA: hypothetical protein VF257_06340 [Solirubrobacteraceae bacterium]